MVRSVASLMWWNKMLILKKIMENKMHAVAAAFTVTLCQL